jgi:SM-20-related protein
MSIQDSVQYNEDEFDVNLVENLQKKLIDSSWKWGYKSTSYLFSKSIPHWSIIFGGVKSANQEYYDCEEELSNIIKDIWVILKNKYFKEDTLVRCYANGITKGIDQKIHTDDYHPDSKTCIVYVNKEWNVDWGGETIIWNRDKRQIIHSYLPKYNSILIIPGNCYHGVRPVSSYCDDLRISLMFKTRKNGTLQSKSR